ncbi:MAG: hypothetical protein R3E50_03950 [Halioglobus sp.]
MARFGATCPCPRQKNYRHGYLHGGGGYGAKVGADALAGALALGWSRVSAALREQRGRCGGRPAPPGVPSCRA